MIKRILAIILVLIMVINLSSCSIFKRYGNVKIKFDKKTGILTVSGEGEIHNYHPHHKDDLEEYDDGTIKKVVIKEGITYIKNSFNHLVKLESIKFPSSLHTIEESFIETQELSKLSIPATVKKIFNKSFSFGKIEDVKFNGPIEITCPGSFQTCRVKSVRIPKDSVLCGAFTHCFFLEEVIFEEGVSYYKHHKASDGTDYVKGGFSNTDNAVRFYAYEPFYKGDDREAAVNAVWDAYFPVTVPKGEDYKKYEDKFKVNDEHLFMDEDRSQMHFPYDDYEVRLPEE